MEKSLSNIENGIKYELRGEQYYPIFNEMNTTEHHIGKYGLPYRDYIKEYKRGFIDNFYICGSPKFSQH